VQVDVFTEVPYLGNPLGVVLDAQGLSDEEMQGITSWANLSETTFVLPPAFVDHVATTLNLGPGAVVDAQWVDNGPGWVSP
jgi:PhzF family phenazine biosynthesis protein